MLEKRKVWGNAAELLLCLWVVGTEVWYYAHFRTLFGAFARAFLRR
jgi:hypothetical protein